MVEDDRRGGLFRNDLMGLRQRHADAVGGVEQPEDGRVLRQIGAGAVAPRVALSALFGQPELAANPAMGVFGERLRRLHGESVLEIGFAVLAGRLQRLRALRRRRADGDDLQSDRIGRNPVVGLAQVVG